MLEQVPPPQTTAVSNGKEYYAIKKYNYSLPVFYLHISKGSSWVIS